MKPRTPLASILGQRTPEGADSLPALPPSPPWMRDALCAQVPDPDVFFPAQSNEGLGDARAICALCPVRAECLQYSLDIDARFGVFGGLAERQRARLRKGGAA